MAAFSVLAWPLHARGSRETGTVQEGRVLLVYPLGAEPDRMVRERLDLPDSASTLFWSSYRVEGGRVSIERSGAYSLPRLVSRQEDGPFAVYEYRVSMVPADKGRRRIEVNFTVEDTRSAGLQPAPYAVREGVHQGGAASGSVRLVEIDHDGRSRFRAVVELN